MDIITLGTDILIAITLIYCIILERRIRQFRNQEAIFKNLIGEVSRSTFAAQSAVTALKQALNDAQQKQSASVTAVTEPLVATRDFIPEQSVPKAQPKMPNVNMSASDLARHFAELRLAGPTS
ncbi:MAG: hypothetical protein WCO61_07010 [Alphaproteobacteria bacterium]